MSDKVYGIMYVDGYYPDSFASDKFFDSMELAEEHRKEMFDKHLPHFRGEKNYEDYCEMYQIQDFNLISRKTIEYGNA